MNLQLHTPIILTLAAILVLFSSQASFAQLVNYDESVDGDLMDLSFSNVPPAHILNAAGTHTWTGITNSSPGDLDSIVFNVANGFEVVSISGEIDNTGGYFFKWNLKTDPFFVSDVVGELVFADNLNSGVGSIDPTVFPLPCGGYALDHSFATGTAVLRDYTFTIETRGVAVVLPGDCNQDCVVNFSDIPAFISILIAGDYLPEADTDQNDVVDFADIPHFIEVLLAS